MTKVTIRFEGGELDGTEREWEGDGFPPRELDGYVQAGMAVDSGSGHATYRPPRQPWLLVDGRTADGTHVQVRESELLSTAWLRVFIDGKEIGTGDVGRLRDGGTTKIDTSRGPIVAFRRLGQEHYDTFNGERLVPAKETTDG